MDKNDVKTINTALANTGVVGFAALEGLIVLAEILRKNGTLPLEMLDVLETSVRASIRNSDADLTGRTHIDALVVQYFHLARGGG